MEEFLFCVHFPRNKETRPVRIVQFPKWKFLKFSHCSLSPHWESLKYTFRERKNISLKSMGWFKIEKFKSHLFAQKEEQQKNKNHKQLACEFTKEKKLVKTSREEPILLSQQQQKIIQWLSPTMTTTTATTNKTTQKINFHFHIKRFTTRN
jgi:hypothetical protein